MNKVLFLPLNTNHVIIFKSIINALNCKYEILCHDLIADAQHYQTEQMLKKLDLNYIHYPGQIKRSRFDIFFVQIINFFKIKKLIKLILQQVKPSLLVLAIDNDPIARTFIHLSKKTGIKTFLIQEGLVRPHEYSMRKVYLSDIIAGAFSCLGIYLNYSKYGTSGCDKILVSGMRAARIFKERIRKGSSIEIVGQPKYDNYLNKLADYHSDNSKNKRFLFAAGTNVVKNTANIDFLRTLLLAIKECGAYLTVKMHPRTPETPEDIYNIIGEQDTSFFEIVKQSDDTFDILKDIYALITVSSTMIIEALLMDKEGIAVDYLAGEQRLNYSAYGAVHTIDHPNQISDVINIVLKDKKPYTNKRRLLEEELFKLDGKAASRIAEIIQSSL
jgi:UDP-N-acetylglucosamine 2-epimerase